MGSVTYVCCPRGPSHAGCIRSERTRARHPGAVCERCQARLPAERAGAGGAGGGAADARRRRSRPRLRPCPAGCHTLAGPPQHARQHASPAQGRGERWQPARSAPLVAAPALRGGAPSECACSSLGGLHVPCTACSGLGLAHGRGMHAPSSRHAAVEVEIGQHLRQEGTQTCLAWPGLRECAAHAWAGTRSCGRAGGVAWPLLAPGPSSRPGAHLALQVRPVPHRLVPRRPAPHVQHPCPPSTLAGFSRLQQPCTRAGTQAGTHAGAPQRPPWPGHSPVPAELRVRPDHGLKVGLIKERRADPVPPRGIEHPAGTRQAQWRAGRLVLRAAAPHGDAVLPPCTPAGTQKAAPPSHPGRDARGTCARWACRVHW